MGALNQDHLQWARDYGFDATLYAGIIYIVTSAYDVMQDELVDTVREFTDALTLDAFMGVHKQ